jgi:hypothetical protein
VRLSIDSNHDDVCQPDELFLHRMTPPLRDVVRVQLSQLDRSKRNEYLGLVLKESAQDLKVKLDSNRTLDSITRTAQKRQTYISLWTLRKSFSVKVPIGAKPRLRNTERQSHRQPRLLRDTTAAYRCKMPITEVANS